MPSSSKQLELMRSEDFICANEGLDLHFFFFFFGRANLEECGNILKLLLVYESSYVQKIIKIKQPSSSVNQLWKLSSYILKEL